MAKQDPFAKDDKVEGTIKDDFADFTDPTGNPKGSNRTKIIIAVLLLGALAGGGIFYFTQSGEFDTAAEEAEVASPAPVKKANRTADLSPKPLPKVPAATTPTPQPHLETPAMPAPAPAPSAQEEAVPTSPKIETAPIHTEGETPTTQAELTKNGTGTETAEGDGEEESPEMGTSPIALQSPGNGALLNYDESAGTPEFTWTGKGRAWIAFSKNPKMSPIDLKALIKGTSFRWPKPAPGVWYWQVKNASEKSEVRMFTVNPPVKRMIAILEPKDGANLLKDSGIISWRGDRMVTYYRVEFSNQGWANPNYRFATTGTQIQMHSVPQGEYQMRVGAFSEVSGRWEYTDPIKVAVQ